MPTPNEPREEWIDGVLMYTYDLPDEDNAWADVDADVREEQDNDYAAEQMADMWDDIGGEA